MSLWTEVSPRRGLWLLLAIDMRPLWWSAFLPPLHAKWSHRRTAAPSRPRISGLVRHYRRQAVGRAGGMSWRISILCRASCPRTLIARRAGGCSVTRGILSWRRRRPALDFHWNRSWIKNRLLETDHRLWKKFEFNIPNNDLWVY